MFLPNSPNNFIFAACGNTAIPPIDYYETFIKDHCETICTKENDRDQLSQSANFSFPNDPKSEGGPGGQLGDSSLPEKQESFGIGIFFQREGSK